ncbi:hypothetical protein Tco_0957582 [Tanacetum coccineum]
MFRVDRIEVKGHIARQCTHPKGPQNSEYFKDKMLLMQALENGKVFDEEQLLFIAGGQANTFGDDMEAYWKKIYFRRTVPFN